MFNNKKAQSLSMQTIIVAALALLVLAIVTLIFTGRIGDLNTEMGKCEPKATCVLDDGRDCNAVALDNGKRGTEFKGECSPGFQCCLFS